MTRYSDLAQVQANGDGGLRSMTQMVVIHATDNAASAWNEANYAITRPDQTSAHFYSDEVDVIQALDTSHIAYGCYPIGNSRSVQFELCGLSNQLTDATLRRIAPFVARVCNDYGMPIRKISSADLVNGVTGICGHLDVTYAWGEGDHTDPGANFPWSTFIGYVQAAASPAPSPPPALVREDDEYSMNGELNLGTERTMVGGDFVNGGLAKNGPAWLIFFTDGALLHEKGVNSVDLRLALTDGKGWNVPIITLGDGGTNPDGTKRPGWVISRQLDTGFFGARIDRLGLVATADPSGAINPDGSPVTSKDFDPKGQVEVGWCLMYGPKTV